MHVVLDADVNHWSKEGHMAIYRQPNLKWIDLHIGKRLAEERLKRGLTQSNVAEILGVRFQQIQKYESGANRILPSSLHAIAASYGMTAGEFFPPADMEEPESTTETALLYPDSLKLLKVFNQIKAPELRRSVIVIAEECARIEGD